MPTEKEGSWVVLLPEAWKLLEEYIKPYIGGPEEEKFFFCEKIVHDMDGFVSMTLETDVILKIPASFILLILSAPQDKYPIGFLTNLSDPA